MATFENLKQLPIEKVEIVVHQDGETKNIPALSKHWVEDRCFLTYEIPKIYQENGAEIVGAKDKWIETTGIILDNLEYLLKLPYFKFWSSLIHNPAIMDTLLSILQDSPTFYVLDQFPYDEKMKKLLVQLREKVLVIFARIVTTKETPSEFMEREFHGSLIYKHFLITVPIMLDLCQLYGREHANVIGKIIKCAMKLQPLYQNDFFCAAKFLSNILQTIEQRYTTRSSIDTDGILLPSENGENIGLPEIQDVIVHLTDISSNISVLLTVYPPAIEFFSNETFLTRIVTIYGITMSEIHAQLRELAHNNEQMIVYIELKQYLLVTRMELMKIFRTLTFKSIMDLIEQSVPVEQQNAKEVVDQFLDTLVIILADKDFTTDYNTVYPVNADVELLQQLTPDLDAVKLNCLMRAIAENPSAPAKSIVPGAKAQRNPEVGAGPSTAGPSTAGPQSTNGPTPDIPSLISSVKDIMCDLGEGFIERCLKHYNYDKVAVINAILEDTLVPELKELDRTLPYIPPDADEAKAAIDLAVGVERLNVFDGDEFDVMTRDVDTSRMHRGKRKGKYKNTNDLLNDKSFKNDLMDIYSKYGIIDDEYDDEYDDTYESQDVGLRGADEPLEMDVKSFTTPRVLMANKKSEFQPEEENEVETEEPVNTGSFLQDPAVLRARAEQRRQSRGRGASGDVVGRPRGQGNDQAVLVNRERKNKNKATRGNHNRRTGAEWKRRQGMMPS